MHLVGGLVWLLADEERTQHRHRGSNYNNTVLNGAPLEALVTGVLKLELLKSCSQSLVSKTPSSQDMSEELQLLGNHGVEDAKKKKKAYQIMKSTILSEKTLVYKIILVLSKANCERTCKIKSVCNLCRQSSPDNFSSYSTV